MITIEKITAELENKKVRSSWNKGVKEYAFELLENIYKEDELANINLFKKALLNGASDWEQYSWGGCAFIYDSQIARRLCTPSELKRTDNGRKRPNKYEERLDTQARALTQASLLLQECFYDLTNGGVN